MGFVTIEINLVHCLFRFGFYKMKLICDLISPFENYKKILSHILLPDNILISLHFKNLCVKGLNILKSKQNYLGYLEGQFQMLAPDQYA